MYIVLGMAGLCILMVMAYAVLAIFFPEWVGITGKKSKEVNQSHQDVVIFPKGSYLLTGIPAVMSLSLEQKLFPKILEVIKDIDLEKNQVTIDFEGNVDNPHPKVTIQPK